jgi:hypothetical protein
MGATAHAKAVKVKGISGWTMVSAQEESHENKNLPQAHQSSPQVSL